MVDESQKSAMRTRAKSETGLIFIVRFFFLLSYSGLGYIVGSQTAKLIGSWHWGLRVTPIAGAIAVLLILLVIEDPPRGESEGAHLAPTSWWADIRSLCKKYDYIWKLTYSAKHGIYQYFNSIDS